MLSEIGWVQANAFFSVAISVVYAVFLLIDNWHERRHDRLKLDRVQKREAMTENDTSEQRIRRRARPEMLRTGRAHDFL